DRSAGVCFAIAIILGGAAGMAVAVRPLVGATLGLALLLAVPLGAALLRRRPVDPLEPLWPFLICYGIASAFKPLLDARGGRTYDWFTFDAELAVQAVVVAAAALIVIYAGYYCGLHRALLPVLPSIRRDPAPARARAAALLLAAGGVVALLLLRR